jgi:hypothetical protein
MEHSSKLPNGTQVVYDNMHGTVIGINCLYCFALFPEQEVEVSMPRVKQGQGWDTLENINKAHAKAIIDSPYNLN